MPQTKEVHKEYMRKLRGSQKGSQIEGGQVRGSQTITKMGGFTAEGSQEYPAIIHALTDPVKRKKLEKVTQSLKAHNVLKEVMYGVSGPTFDVVGDLLEATS